LWLLLHHRYSLTLERRLPILRLRWKDGLDQRWLWDQ
jgi:hypothetical protein